MIFIWDNGGEYSDHEVVLLQSALDWKILEPLMEMVYSRKGRLLAQAPDLEWFEGEPSLLADRVSPDDFFRRPEDPAPDSSAPKKYDGGPYINSADENAAQKRSYDASKYKLSSRGFGVGTSPIEHRFDLLTSASARELLDGWKHRRSNVPDGLEYEGARSSLQWCDWNTENFITECRERRLL